MDTPTGRVGDEEEDECCNGAGWAHEEGLGVRVEVVTEVATSRGRTGAGHSGGGSRSPGTPQPPAVPFLLSTSRVTKASVDPRGLLALQMYWPESCCAARGMTRLPFTTRCCQGRGARSFDHSIRGAGSPTTTPCPSPWCQVLLRTSLLQACPYISLQAPHTSGHAVQRGGVPGHHGDRGRCGDLGGAGVPLC